MMKRLLFLQNSLLEKCSLSTEVINRALGVDCLKYVNNIYARFGSGGNIQCSRTFHVCVSQRKMEDRREMMASLPRRDEGTEGERGIDIDSSTISQEDMFPDEGTPTRVFNGIIFRDLPICHIKASKNNTIITLSDPKGAVKFTRSCGMEGFKNTRKGTNIAAQATAIGLGSRALDHGYKTVRVRVKGLGPGRMSAIKGLQMSGMDIISVTDNTDVSWNPLRPRKRRKV